MIAEAWQRVSVVVIAYNSGAVIGSCLPSLLQARELFVVDNASTDDTVEVVQQAAPNAKIVKIGDNLGYGAGANEGLRRATGEFALIVTPDVELKPGALEFLVEAADRYPRAGAIAPALLQADGTLARSHDAALTDRDGMSRKRNDPFPEGDVCAGYLSGAVMLLRKKAVEEIGYFDPEIFLFYEDDDLCVRLSRAGWSSILVPAAVAGHVGGASTPWSWEIHWRKFWHMGWSRLYFERKHRGAKAAWREGARALLRYAGKALAGFFRSDQVKTTRDLARLCGTAGFLLGFKGRGF